MSPLRSQMAVFSPSTLDWETVDEKDIELNGTEQNRPERNGNGTEWKRTERNRTPPHPPPTSTDSSHVSCLTCKATVHFRSLVIVLYVGRHYSSILHLIVGLGASGSGLLGAGQAVLQSITGNHFPARGLDRRLGCSIIVTLATRGILAWKIWRSERQRVCVCVCVCVCVGDGDLLLICLYADHQMKSHCTRQDSLLSWFCGWLRGRGQCLPVSVCLHR